MKPNYRDGKINQKYYQVLLRLSNYGYFVEYPDFNNLLRESTNSVKYQQVKLNIEKFDMQDNFGIIYFDELQKILDFKGELIDTGIDISRMSPAYILLLLAYLRVNMNRNSEKPLCCYRHYQKISVDTGISVRYVSRIIKILDTMQIIKSHDTKRIKYVDSTSKTRFSTPPKIFADYRRFIKSPSGEIILDNIYDCNTEINKQIELMEKENYII